jgi:tryptophan-rich sensory protein
MDIPPLGGGYGPMMRTLNVFNWHLVFVKFHMFYAASLYLILSAIFSLIFLEIASNPNTTAIVTL